MHANTPVKPALVNPANQQEGSAAHKPDDAKALHQRLQRKSISNPAVHGRYEIRFQASCRNLPKRRGLNKKAALIVCLGNSFIGQTETVGYGTEMGFKKTLTVIFSSEHMNQHLIFRLCKQPLVLAGKGPDKAQKDREAQLQLFSQSQIGCVGFSMQDLKVNVTSGQLLLPFSATAAKDKDKNKQIPKPSDSSTLCLKYQIEKKNY